MKIETTPRDDHQVKLVVELDSEVLEKYMHQAARKFSADRKIAGFRPGKAPYDMVRRLIGDEALQQQAIDLMLDTVYPEALQQAEITPGGPGQLEAITSFDPPVISFIVPLTPEVTLGDYRSIRKDYKPEETTDDEVDATARHLLLNYATTTTIERPAEDGNVVVIKMSAILRDPATGEESNLIDETEYQIVAGESDPEDEAKEWPYPGFAKQLMGASAGERKMFVYEFSEETPYDNLRGKHGEFNVFIDAVKEVELPEMTEEFLNSLGGFTSEEEFKEAVRTQITNNRRQEYEEKYFEELVNEIVDQATVKYPPQALDEEIHSFIHNLEHNLEHENMDLTTYLKVRNLDQAKFIETEVTPAAARRLARTLVLEKLADVEGLQLSNEEYQMVYSSAVQQVKSSTELKKLQRKNPGRQLAASMAMDTATRIFNFRLMSRLKSIATGTPEFAASEPVEAAETEEPSEAAEA